MEEAGVQGEVVAPLGSLVVASAKSEKLNRVFGFLIQTNVVYDEWPEKHRKRIWVGVRANDELTRAVQTSIDSAHSLLTRPEMLHFLEAAKQNMSNWLLLLR